MRCEICGSEGEQVWYFGEEYGELCTSCFKEASK